MSSPLANHQRHPNARPAKLEGTTLSIRSTDSAAPDWSTESTSSTWSTKSTSPTPSVPVSVGQPPSAATGQGSTTGEE